MHVKFTRVSGACFPSGSPPHHSVPRRATAYVGVVIGVIGMMVAGVDVYNAAQTTFAAVYVAAEIAALAAFGARHFASQIARQVVEVGATRGVMAAG